MIARLWLVSLLTFLCVVSAAAQQTAAIPCNAKQIYDASTNGSTRLITAPASGGRSIFICGYTIFATGTVSVGFNYGTGTNCGTGAVALTPAFQLKDQSGIAEAAAAYRGMNAIVGNDVCINTNAAVAVQAIVYYVVR